MADTRVRRVFLTGGTGHVGGALLALLRDDAAFDVVALTRREPPGEDGGVCWMHGDLAGVAMLALRGDPAVAGTALRLTGPAVVTQREQVALVGTALGRHLGWVELEPDDVRAQLVDVGWPAATADAALTAWSAMREHPEEVADVERVTRRPGRSFVQWARDHVADFR